LTKLLQAIFLTGKNDFNAAQSLYTHQKVKVNYWIFQHNQILRKHVLVILKRSQKKLCNAIVRYYNNDNKKENLTKILRELLELFTQV
jgi:hypothetical protein